MYFIARCIRAAVAKNTWESANRDPIFDFDKSRSIAKHKDIMPVRSTDWDKPI